MASRKQRLDNWVRTAPPGTRFIGFGGSGYEHETAVFHSDRFGEVRFPFRPSAFAPDAADYHGDGYDAVASGYGCFSAPSWEHIIELCDSIG